MKNALLVVPLGLIALALAAWSGSPAGAEKSMLKAGAAAVKITPSLERTVYIAGYNQNRVAESVHDDLWARALVLDDGKSRLAVVSCDLIGLSNFRIRQYRAAVRSVPAENVFICCTHVHSGPDTLGLWGPNPGKTGMDPAYMETLGKQIVEAVESAAKELKPVRVSAGTIQVPDGLVHNSREPIQDKTLTALRFADADGRTIATTVNYGSHPEINKSKAITSDFVDGVRKKVEAKYGGVAVWLNGALGGMVTPDIKEHTWEEQQRVGDGVGQAAMDAVAAAKPVTVDRLSIARKPVEIPLENDGFKLMLAAKVLEGPPGATDIQTEVWRLDLGPIVIVTIPGEVLPKPELALKKEIPGPYPMVVALGNDELGYILDPEDIDKKLYSYEKTMSVGKQAWPKLHEAAKELLK